MKAVRFAVIGLPTVQENGDLDHMSEASTCQKLSNASN